MNQLDYKLTLLWIVLIFTQKSLMAEAMPPNLVVIMADDLGYSDVGFNGCKDIKTPNIDELAKSGVRFSNGYTTYSVCGPSRAGFITGRYQGRFGFGRNPQYQPKDPNMGLPQDEKTLASILRPKGYHSGVIGKWHLGSNRDAHHPLNRGFDEFFGHLGGGHQYFPEKLTIKDSYSINSESESYRTWIMRDHEPVKIDQYLSDEFSEEAVEFIGRNRSKPFFLFLSYNAPHAPLQASEKYMKRYTQIKDKKRRTYAAMVSAIDDGVGLILEKLKKEELDKNTLIFFLSDNGGPTRSNASQNRPLRGGKSDVWEGGYRVPFIASWPSVISPDSDFDHPVNSLDIAATIVGLSNSKISEAKPLDGKNLIPFLKGDEKGAPHETIMIRKFDQKRFAMRKGDMKLVKPKEEEEPRLYDLSKDISEKNDISSDQPELVKKMQVEFDAWAAELKDPIFLGLIHRKKWKKK